MEDPKAYYEIPFGVIEHPTKAAKRGFAILNNNTYSSHANGGGLRTSESQHNYSVNTYYLAHGAEDWKEVLITEYDME